jgi:hypothetical protein
VTTDTTRFLELLERRIALLGSLAAALIAARADAVGFDLDGLETRIADQENLCGEIRSLDADIDQVQCRCAVRLGVSQSSTQVVSKSGDTRMQETLDRLRAAQASVKQLNDAHQHLLVRSRRTAGALLNSYRTFSMTYSDPARSTRTYIGERA